MRGWAAAAKTTLTIGNRGSPGGHDTPLARARASGGALCLFSAATAPAVLTMGGGGGGQGDAASLAALRAILPARPHQRHGGVSRNPTAVASQGGGIRATGGSRSTGETGAAQVELSRPRGRIAPEGSTSKA